MTVCLFITMYRALDDYKRSKIHVSASRGWRLAVMSKAAVSIVPSFHATSINRRCAKLDNLLPFSDHIISVVLHTHNPIIQQSL